VKTTKDEGLEARGEWEAGGLLVHEEVEARERKKQSGGPPSREKTPHDRDAKMHSPETYEKKGGGSHEGQGERPSSVRSQGFLNEKGDQLGSRTWLGEKTVFNTRYVINGTRSRGGGGGGAGEKKGSPCVGFLWPPTHDGFYGRTPRSLLGRGAYTARAAHD